MSRPSHVHINPAALLHNVQCVKAAAPGRKIIAMVKANAYGCGLSTVVPVLNNVIDAFGVACLEEAMAVRRLGSNLPCILFQGAFTPDELEIVAQEQFECVVHHAAQLDWILRVPQKSKIKIWIKINTGMHRLGFEPHEIPEIINKLQQCAWVKDDISLMTHFASADEPNHPSNDVQIKKMNDILLPHANITRSLANSAAILALPESHAEVVRPGIMLYGVSPFPNQTGQEIGLQPVMRFSSAITAIHHYPANAPIGYGGTWQRDVPTVIGIIPVGYGDGYPRSIASNTPVWIKNHFAPIVGRVSMDMLTVDLTDCPEIQLGDEVELWGEHVPVERVAQSAGTIGYELLCKVTSRVR
jgi:alanine racemase